MAGSLVDLRAIPLQCCSPSQSFPYGNAEGKKNQMILSTFSFSLVLLKPFSDLISFSRISLNGFNSQGFAQLFLHASVLSTIHSSFNTTYAPTILQYNSLRRSIITTFIGVTLHNLPFPGGKGDHSKEAEQQMTETVTQQKKI